MNDSPLVQVRRDGAVSTLILNRPDSLNALNVPLVAALRRALDDVANDASVGAVVLTGAGRGFCSGGDLREGAAARPTETQGREFEQWADNLRSAMECSRILHQMPKPTIAMMRGPAAGAGLSLATACDLRIVADDATFTTAFVKVGFPGDFGITWFLTRLVGTAKARELMYLSEKIDAQEALRIGLVNRVLPSDQLEAATMQIACRIGSGPRVANRYIKRNLDAAETCGLTEALDMEAHHLTLTRTTDDHKEAVRAFHERRPPVFKGA